MTDQDASFLARDYIDLAQPRLGSEVIYASDEFFAPKERLIDPADPVFIPDKYDDHGKWMDGWESRRRRTPGHDFCIVRLGSRGRIKGFEIDTRHFTGNFPPFASIDGCLSNARIPPPDSQWIPLVPRLALAGDSRRFLVAPGDHEVTHVRLNIFPDGGVARLRIFGEVMHDWSKVDSGTRIDLAAMAYGGKPIYANDEHFGRLGNIIAPGRAANMGDGWETRRRREPGHDWGILQLAHPGTITDILLDTQFFKGNFPDRCAIQGALVSTQDRDRLIAESASWPFLLPEQKLRADHEHLFKAEIIPHGPVSHVRVNMIPDGGIARLRLFGHIARRA